MRTIDLAPGPDEVIDPANLERRPLFVNQLASELPTKPQIPVMKSFIARADNEVQLRTRQN